MKKINVLLTSAGVATAVNVISSLRESNIYDFTIIATDMSHLSAGLMLADKYYITPPSTDYNFLSHLKKIIDIHNIDFVFPLHSSEIETFSQCRNQLESLKVGIGVLASPEVVRICNDKNLFEHFLAKHKLPAPTRFKNVNDIPKFPVFLKNRFGSSSVGALKINSLEDLMSFTNGDLSQYVVQEFLDDNEITVDCYVSKSNRLVGCVPRYRLKIKDGKTIIGKTLYDPIITSMCSHLLSKLNYKGPCNIQMFYGNDSIKIIEINPRLSAGGLPLATKSGVNIPELMIKDFYGELGDDLLVYNHNLTMFRYFSEVFA